MTDQYRATSLRLPVETLEWLKIEAHRGRVSMAKVVAEAVDAHRGRLGYGGTTELRQMRCPACDAEAYYTRRLDRFIHADGSANDQCWRALTRGDAVPVHVPDGPDVY